MNNINLLPADKYKVVNKTILTSEDHKNLISLYEPIIGSNAVSLYITLWRDLEKYKNLSLEYNHHHLMTILKSDLKTIKQARESLEAMGLIKTFYKEGIANEYIYELYSPLSAKEFFNHPILNVVLYNNIGKFEYDILKKEYEIEKIDLTGFSDISKNLDETFKAVSVIDNFETNERTTLELNLQNKLDFEFIVSALPKNMVNERTFNKRVRELLNNLAFIYNLDSLKISELLRTVINEKVYINKEDLRIAARKYYQYSNTGKLPTLIYRTQPDYLKTPVGDNSKRGKIIGVFENTSPYNFLKNKNKGANPTLRELKLLESLLIDVGLKPAVVNVLIDYVLRTNNNKLSAPLIETIATHWKREGIETAVEAMNLAEKQNKKYTKKMHDINPKVKIIEKPIWFNENIEKETITKEESEELEELLSEFR